MVAWETECLNRPRVEIRPNAIAAGPGTQEQTGVKIIEQGDGLNP
jgi:hypothetical protein